MHNPTVACVLLANGRPEMVRRAVKSFRAQTYADKHLLIYDTSEPNMIDLCELAGVHMDDEDVTIRESKALDHHGNRKSIGYLRNRANHNASFADIICHWDSDDWSHPNRIAEQVALLQSSGAECVGYNEMLFWADACAVHFCGMTPGGVSCACGNRYPRTYGYCNKCKAPPPDAEAWLYRSNIPTHTENYAIGTSMMYWRSTWEQFPFPDYSEGCDDLRWASGDSKTGTRAVKIVAKNSLAFLDTDKAGCSPRMIASIHGGNTCANVDSTSKGGKEVWKRVPSWDGYCREAMKL